MTSTLHPAERAYRRALEVAMAKRQRAIRAELAKGKSLREVGAEFGLSHSRIRELASPS
jgi:DNA-binding CsgD family transcriptional regulator